jgi:hypothetical protein
VGEFEQIAAAESANAEQTLSAQYDLGRVWEAMGEIERARSAYSAVTSVDPDFCEVASRLASLREPEKPEAPADDDFESFEDLMDDDDGDAELAEAEAEDLAVETAEPEYESFSDLIAEGEQDADWLDEAAGATPAAAETEAPEELVVDLELPVAKEEAPAEPNPQLGAGPERDPESEPDKKPARKRKKISFV